MRTKLNQLYISIDVESDGPTPGRNNLLSAGFVACWDNKVQKTASWNLDLLSYCKPHPRTWNEFWNKNEKHRKLYDLTRVDTVDHHTFVNELYAFTKQCTEECGERPVFVAAPSIYDYKWIDFEYEEFYGSNPYGHSQCIDIRTFVFAREQRPFTRVGKRTYPKHWFPEQKHTHIAIDDALEQGELFMNILRHYDRQDNPENYPNETPPPSRL